MSEYRVWNLATTTHISDASGVGPEDALRNLAERYIGARKGRFLVTRIGSPNGNHGEYGIFTVRPAKPPPPPPPPPTFEIVKESL